MTFYLRVIFAFFSIYATFSTSLHGTSDSAVPSENLEENRLDQMEGIGLRSSNLLSETTGSSPQEPASSSILDDLKPIPQMDSNITNSPENLSGEKFSAGIAASDCDDSDCDDSFLSNVRLELGYSGGEYIFLRQSYAEMGLFAPVILGNWAPFLDARAYRFDNGKWGASTGLGIRYRQCDCNVLGANAYYDYRRRDRCASFHQLGLGVEWLGDCWDIRANGYIPLGRQSHCTRCVVFDNFTGGFFAICRVKEFSISGFEAEVGLPLMCWCDFNAYGAAGPYYFRGHDRRDTWGGYARLEINWRTYLSLQAFTSYDHHNRSKFQGRILLSLPLEVFSTWDICNICEDLLTQPVYRHGTIFTDRCCSFCWNWQTNGD